MNRRSFLALTGVPIASGLGWLPTAHAAPSSGETLSGGATSSMDDTSRPGTTNHAVELDGRFTGIDADAHARELRRRGQLTPDATVFDTGTLEAGTFGMVTLSWAGDADAETDELRFLVRARGRSGWSDWHELSDDGHGPDPSSPEGRHARRGTPPMLVGESTAIQVRVETTSTAPPDSLRAGTIDFGDTSADSVIVPQTRVLAADQPAILTREDWGADESIREPGDPDFGEIRGMFVHHTAGGNTYSESAVPSIIRGMYIDHVVNREWRDIGYNFLIDKFGRIWEGRYGGIDKAVIGAHTGGYNTYSFGAAVLGDYTSTEASAAAFDAYRDLIAWKLAANDVDALDTLAYPEGETLPVISGHRDTTATECPGQRVYNKLPYIRRRVAIAMLRVGGLPTITPPPRPR